MHFSKCPPELINFGQLWWHGSSFRLICSLFSGCRYIVVKHTLSVWWHHVLWFFKQLIGLHFPIYVFCVNFLGLDAIGTKFCMHTTIRHQNYSNDFCPMFIWLLNWHSHWKVRCHSYSLKHVPIWVKPKLSAFNVGLFSFHQTMWKCHIFPLSFYVKNVAAVSSSFFTSNFLFVHCLFVCLSVCLERFIIVSIRYTVFHLWEILMKMRLRHTCN